MYALKNIVYFSISLALVIVALLFKDKDIRVRVLYLELLYWLIKLFITNKAHLVGIGGYTVANVTPFDYLSLVVRLQLINVVLEKKAKLAKVLIVAAIVILCKIALHRLFIDQGVFSHVFPYTAWLSGFLMIYTGSKCKPDRAQTLDP